MSILSKGNLITFGFTVLGTMVGCMLAPKLMKIVSKKETSIVVPPIIEGEEIVG